MVGRAKRATTRVRDRAEARRSVRDHHTHVPAQLALHADRVTGDRGSSTGEQRREDLEELALVDGAAAQLEIDLHVVRDGRRGRERVDVLRPRVHDPRELFHVPEIAERLDAARGRARTDGDEDPRLCPELTDPLGVVRRGDGPLDERDIVRTPEDRTRGLGEVHEADGLGEEEQLVLAIEQAELAAVAGGELEDGELGLRLLFLRGHVIPPSPRAGAPPGRIGTRDRPCTRTRARTGNGRRGRRRNACCAPW